MSSSENSLFKSFSFVVIMVLFSTVLMIAAMRIYPKDIGASFALGAGLTTFSFLSLGLTLYLMFLKKNVALLIAVIVFKWPLLIYFLHLLIQSMQVHYLSFILGSLVWLPSALIWHFLLNRD